MFREKYGTLYHASLHNVGHCSFFDEKCPYRNHKIVERRCWHNVNMIEDLGKTWYDVSDLLRGKEPQVGIESHQIMINIFALFLEIIEQFLWLL